MKLTPEQQPIWNSIIVDILREFIEICNKYNLTYFCAGGTAIGAVRHHGMIPWDDDIDVFMPRPDYNKFIALKNELNNGKYEITTPYDTPNYPMYFSKLCNRNTTLVEEADTPCLLGLYIDVFPLDGTSDDLKEAMRLKEKFRRLQNRLEAISTHNSFGEYLSLLKKPSEWGRFLRKAYGFFFRQSYRLSLLNKMDNICSTYNYESANNVITYCGVYGEREIYPKSWLKSTIEFPFEELNVKLCVDYDKYLRHFFGDYMKLPPVEQRTTHHYKAYYNMDRRVPIKEVINEIRTKKSV